MMPCCPHCHRPYTTERASVPLPPLKAAIFDAIKAAGEIGISSQDLIGSVYETPRSLVTIKSHIHQLNDLLDGTGLRIVSERQGRGGSGRWAPALWRLTRTRRAAA